MLSVNYSLYKYSSSSHDSIFNFTIPLLDRDVSDFIMSLFINRIKWRKYYFAYYASFIKLCETLAGSQNAPPDWFVQELLAPPSEKIETSFAAKGLMAQVQTDRLTHTHIYIYIYLHFIYSISNNVAPFTSKSKEEVYIIYKTGEENNVFKG